MVLAALVPALLLPGTPASSAPKLVVRADAAIRVTPDGGPSRHVVHVRTTKGTARNVTISITGFRDLRSGIGVSAASLEVSPRSLGRVTPRGRQVRLVVGEPETIPAGTYQLVLVARAAGRTKTTATLQLLAGAAGSVSIAPSVAEYSARESWPWKGCLPMGDPCRRTYEPDEITFVITGEGGGYVRDATLSVTGLVNVETERSIAGTVFTDSETSVISERLGVDQAAEIGIALPHLAEPGIYNLRVTAEAEGNDVAAEGNVRLVVSDGPGPAAIVLGLGVFLSFLVTYLRTRRSRVMSQRKAALFETRVDSWARVNSAYADLPLIQSLRASRSHIEFIAGSQGAAAADEYLRELQNLYEALGGVVAHHDHLGTMLERLRTARAAADHVQKEAAHADLQGYESEAALSEREIELEVDRLWRDLWQVDYDQGSREVANTTAKLRKLAERKDDLLTRAEKAVSALEGALGRPVADILAEQPLAGFDEGPPVPPGSETEASKLRIVLEPPSPRAEEAAVMHLKPAFAIPIAFMSPPVWVVSKVDRWSKNRTILGVSDDAYDAHRYEFPEKGTYEVTVEIGGTRVAETSVRVRRSLTADQQREVLRIDAGLSVISFLFALVTGMWIFYFREGIAYFGAPQHYIELFLWGIGIDAATKSLRNVRDRVEAAPSTN